MLVTLEDYSVNEDAADGFDVVVPLKLKQYRPYATKGMADATDENGVPYLKVKETRPSIDKETPAIYKIRNEQSMWEAYGASIWRKLNWRSVMLSNGISNPLGSMKGTVLNLNQMILFSWLFTTVA